MDIPKSDHHVGNDDEVILAPKGDVTVKEELQAVVVVRSKGKSLLCTPATVTL